jgi:uncharacterized protein YdcH (DUF465 family)
LRAGSDEPRSKAAGRIKSAKTIVREHDLLRLLSLPHTERMARMNKAHVDALASKHAALHATITQEEHRPHPDTDLLHRLKKEKLRLKDELVGH